MQPKYLTSLEFDKILSRAAQGVVCPEARGLLLEEQPGDTPQAVRDKLAETDAMTALLIKNGTPRFDRVENMKHVVNRACKGGVLSMAELLELARTLRNFRELTAWYHITEHDALCIDDHFYAMTPQPALEKAIGQAIVSPTEMADTASDTLYDIRRKIRGVEFHSR